MYNLMDKLLIGYISSNGLAMSKNGKKKLFFILLHLAGGVLKIV